MIKKHKKSSLTWIRNILLILFLVVLTIIVFVLINEDRSIKIPYEGSDASRYYSREKSDNSNIEIVVSNQSFENPSVTLSCLVDGIEIFEEEFDVGDQHNVSYYFVNIIEGDHILKVTSEDGQVEEYKFETGQNKKYFYITYWGNKDTARINIFESDDFIGID